MNDIDKIPLKCRDCPYWEIVTYPWCCGDCKDRLKKPVSDFVSRQWLIDEYHRRHEGPPGGALKMIEDAPAADVEPKRKTGRWVYKYRTQVHYHKETGEDVITGEKRTVMVYDDLSGKYPHCPYCDALAADNFMDYCPHCGAKMDKELTKEEDDENNNL